MSNGDDMKTDLLPTIPRAELIALTESALESSDRDIKAAIEDWEDNNYDEEGWPKPQMPSQLLKSLCMAVAKTAHYVTPMWDAQIPLEGYGKCGCLIGTARMQKDLNAEPDLSEGTLEKDSYNAESVIGQAFFEQMQVWWEDSNGDDLPWVFQVS